MSVSPSSSPRSFSRSVSPSVRSVSPSVRSGASYASSPLYSFSELMLNETLRAAEEMISKWSLEKYKFSKVDHLFPDNRTEAKEFIKRVKDLQHAMNFLIYDDPNSEKLVQAQILMQTAMKRLEKEFYQLLSNNRDHLDPESISARSSHASRSTIRSGRSSSFSDLEEDITYEDEIQVVEDSLSKVEEASTLAMVDIKMVADCMISSGYGKECIKIYKIIRKSIVDEGIYRLGVIHIKSSSIKKMDWDVLELKIKTWLNAVKIAVRTLFNGERILCDYVFANSNTMRESCFSEVVKEGGRILFGFPKKVAKSKRPSPERIFRILDLYNAVAALWPEIESIFSFESISVVRSKAIGSLTRLGESVRSIITDFESAINKDSAKSHFHHGGGIHQLTRDAMNHISQLSDYEIPLSDIFADWPFPVHSSIPESLLEISNPEDDPASPAAVRLAWLILVLLCKIDLKAEFYKDVALSYIFLANNLHFVISKVRQSNLRLVLGQEWISRNESKLKQYIFNYEKVGWNKVLSALPENTADEIAPEEVKFRLKRFNAAFEATYRTQSSWVISDNKLRDEVEALVSNKVVSAYTAFCERYREVVMDTHTKFRPDELTKYMSKLFHDKKVSGSSPSQAR